MSDPFQKRGIPNTALIGAGALIGLALLATTAHVQWGFGAGIHGPGGVVNERELVFADDAFGGITILDGENGNVVETYAPGSGNFIRNLVRLLAKERLALGGSSETPFHLILREGGYVSLVDPVTERSIELNAFGKDNLAAFVALLPMEETET